MPGWFRPGLGFSVPCRSSRDRPGAGPGPASRSSMGSAATKRSKAFCELAHSVVAPRCRAVVASAESLHRPNFPFYPLSVSSTPRCESSTTVRTWIPGRTRIGCGRRRVLGMHTCREAPGSSRGTAAGRPVSSRPSAAAVRGHAPADAREDEARARILDCLDSLPRPFDEEADPVHVTGSAVVVGRRGTVLHLHKRLHRWMQPGGHIDPAEAPWDAALRESEEETGLVAPASGRGSPAHPRRRPRGGRGPHPPGSPVPPPGPRRGSGAAAGREPRGPVVPMGRGRGRGRRRPGRSARGGPAPARGARDGRPRWRRAGGGP